MRIGFLPLGCARNGIDAEGMIRRLLGAGHEITLTPDADCACVVIHTCGFTDEAKQESIDAILEASRLRLPRQGKRRIVVTGCLAERYGEELARELPEIDVVVPLAGMDRILEHAEPGVRRSEHPAEGDFRLTPRHYAYLRIADGCDNHCAYCVIPSIRGGLRSRPAGEIEAEARLRLAEGAVELNLIAQDTANWGRDRADGDALPDLLRRLDRLEGLAWLRLLYLHPAHLDGRLLETLAGLTRLVPYLDLPFQHASPGLLAAMNRGGSGEEFLQLLGRARQALPGLTVRSAFIVGFPGETEADVEQLADFLQAARLERVAFFRYSAEEGTPAAALPGQISESEKAERLEHLESLQARITVETESSFAGQELTALVEGLDEEESQLFLRSAREAPEVDGGIFAPIPAETPPPAGTFVRVRIEDPCPFAMQGVIL